MTGWWHGAGEDVAQAGHELVRRVNSASARCRVKGTKSATWGAARGAEGEAEGGVRRWDQRGVRVRALRARGVACAVRGCGWAFGGAGAHLSLCREGAKAPPQGGAFLKSRSVGGPALPRLREGGKKQKQENAGGEKPRTVDAMVRDAPAALARARLARTRTTHSPTPYLTSGERSRKFNLPTTTGTIGTLVTTGCTRYHRPHPQPTDHHLKPRETSTPSTEHAIQSSNRNRSNKSDARSCHVAAGRPNQQQTPNAAADAATIASRGQFRPAFGQHPGLPWYLAGAADCPVKAPRPPVPLSAALSLSLLPMLRPAS